MASDPKPPGTSFILSMMAANRPKGDGVLIEPPGENLLTGKLTYGGMPVRFDDSLKPGEVSLRTVKDDEWRILRSDLEEARAEISRLRAKAAGASTLEVEYLTARLTLAERGNSAMASALNRARTEVRELASENACLKTTLTAMMNVAAQAPATDVKPLIEELRDTTQSRSVFARCNAVMEKMK